MHIFFLRHGDAVSDSRYTDNARPLSDVGRRQAELVGTFLQRMNVVVDTILSSPLKRAQETASIVSSTIHSQQTNVSEWLLNGSDQQHLFKHLTSLKASSILLIGHEPYLSETISLLIGGQRKVEIEMRKCSLALVDVPFPIHQGTGVLKFLIPVDTIV
jgi:phosphohistidine phosphatase